MSIKGRKVKTVFVAVERVGPDLFIRGRLNGDGHPYRYIRVGPVAQLVDGVGPCVEVELERVSGPVARVRFANGEYADVRDWHDPDGGLKVAG